MTRVCGGVDISLLLNQPVPSYQGLVGMADDASVAGAAGVASMAGERVQKRIIHVVFNPSLIRAGRISVCLLPALILVCSFLFSSLRLFPCNCVFFEETFCPLFPSIASPGVGEGAAAICKETLEGIYSTDQNSQSHSFI